MREKLESIKLESTRELEGVNSLQQLEELRIKYLGKKGELTQVLRGMGALSAEERPIVGQLANEIRDYINEKIEHTEYCLKRRELENRLRNEFIDVTMPSKKKELGNRHPITKVLDEIKDIFIGMGFTIVEGPEIEKVYYNFDALNHSKFHPARDMQDTFYVTEELLLRTQTSPVQVRTMEKLEPPIRILAPGRVYRADEIDATHSPMFHQIEGLVIDKGITMANLKGTLDVFYQRSQLQEAIVSGVKIRLLLLDEIPYLCCMRRHRLQSLQGHRLDRNIGGRNGSSKCIEKLRH
jgi:phenylalanyl-tRNA synthetase alpha chain